MIQYHFDYVLLRPSVHSWSPGYLQRLIIIGS